MSFSKDYKKRPFSGFHKFDNECPGVLCQRRDREYGGEPKQVEVNVLGPVAVYTLPWYHHAGSL